MLNLFCDLKSRFANMVCGMITRDSIKEALTNGITAEQVGVQGNHTGRGDGKHIVCILILLYLYDVLDNLLS